MWDNSKFEDLVGKTLTEIQGKVGDETLVFVCDDGVKYQLHYYDDCCASCNLEDIVGDLKDLIGKPILKATEDISANENPVGVEVPASQDSFTWSFYNISTSKGTVTLRWYGESNGFYSETVTFEKIE